MIRRPPRSTLFPTRRSSDLVALFDRDAQVALAAALGGHQQALVDPPPHGATVGVGLVLRREETQQDERLGEDRKSTRLNSSHANISYAVFCLKKTNKVILPT